MDTVLTPRATEQKQWFAPKKKQMRMKKNNGGGDLISNNKASEHCSTYTGLLNPPPISRAMSISSASSLFNHHYLQQQPPLLPLPHVSPSLRTRDMFLTPDKSKAAKPEEAKKRSGTQTQSILVVANVGDVVPGSVFKLAPPPSSLPLPKFSLRSKLACNAAAGGIDDGATYNLRRLLRLQ